MPGEEEHIFLPVAEAQDFNGAILVGFMCRELLKDFNGFVKFIFLEVYLGEFEHGAGFFALFEAGKIEFCEQVLDVGIVFVFRKNKFDIVEGAVYIVYLSIDFSAFLACLEVAGTSLNQEVVSG